MDAGEPSRPRSLAEIGRSGTFIIEHAANKENENGDVVRWEPVQDKQKTSVSAETEKPTNSKSSHEQRNEPVNNRRRLSDVNITNNGEESSDFKQDREKSLFDTGTKNDGGPAYGRRRKARSIDDKTKQGSLDTSSKNESLEIVPRTVRWKSLDTGTDIENNKVEGFTVTAKNREEKMTKAATGHDSGNTLDSSIKTVSLDIVKETDVAVIDGSGSQDDATKNNENDDSTDEGCTGTLDILSKDDGGPLDTDFSKIEKLDATAKSEQKSVDALEDIKSEPLDVSDNDNKRSPSVINKKDAFDLTSKDDKNVSTDAMMQIDKQDDNNVEAETKQPSSQR